MKITKVTYMRKFGGGPGQSIESYGYEDIGLEAIAGEDEEVQAEDAFKKALQMKKVAYRAHEAQINKSEPKKEG